MSARSAIAGALALAFAATGGCTYEPIPVSVLHSPLVSSGAHRTGVIRVRPLRDRRMVQLRPYVGGASRVPGTPPEDAHSVVLDGDRTLEPLLTDAVDEALRSAGYRTVRDTATPASHATDVNAILGGTIDVFWSNESSGAVWHSILLRLDLAGPAGGEPRWSREFKSHKTRGHGIFTRPDRRDYELTIRGAMDKLMQDMAEAFASEAFFSQLEAAPAAP